MSSKIFRQADSRWGYLPYPSKPSTLATSGCGCCSVAHLLIEMEKYKNITPKTPRKYMVSQGFAIKGHGTSWSGITKTLQHYGYTVKEPNIGSSMKGAWEELNKGDRMGVLLFRGGTRGGVTWTLGGHYVAFVDYKVKNGKHYFKTKDSSGRRNDGWHCYETTMKGLLPKIWIVKRLEKASSTSTKKTTVKVKKPTSKYSGVIPSPTLKKGDNGTKVKNLQKFLNWYFKLSTGVPKLKVDGDFGKATEIRLKLFQKTEKLEQDGVYGKQTKNKFSSYLKTKKKTNN